MLRSEVSHPDVSVAVHRDEANGRAYLGVVIGDAFVPFFEQKLTLFDDLHKLGAEQVAEAKRAQAEADAQAQAVQTPEQ